MKYGVLAAAEVKLLYEIEDMGRQFVGSERAPFKVTTSCESVYLLSPDVAVHG